MQYRLSTLLLLAVVLWSSLAVFGPSWGVGVFVAVVALALYVQRAKRMAPETVWIVVLAVLLTLGFIIGMLLPVVQAAREAAPGAQCFNNLHSIVLALLNYEARYHTFPPAYIADKNGRPMHSWRVLILPDLGENDLYKQYDFSEPWDGPNNRKLLAARPRVYACPADKEVQSPRSTETSYVAVVGPHSAWLGSKPRKLSELSAATTILLVETTDAGIPWTEPRDLSVDSLRSGFSGASVVTASSRHGDYNGFFYSQRHSGGIHVACADGHTEYFPPGGLEPSLLSKCLQIGGFDDAASDEIDASTYRPPSGDDRPHINWTNCLALLVWLISVGLLMRRAVRNRNFKQAMGDSSL